MRRPPFVVDHAEWDLELHTGSAGATTTPRVTRRQEYRNTWCHGVLRIAIADQLITIVQRDVSDTATHAARMHHRDGVAQLVARRDIHRPLLREAIRPIVADPLPLKCLYVLHYAVI